MSDIKEIKPNPKLYIKKINDKIGWGVFCNDKINKDEIIEICYCIAIHESYLEFSDYFFSPDRSECDTQLLSFGYGSIYNHSNNPNITYERSLSDKLIIFKAKRDIEIGEELCHNYGPGYLKRKPLI